MTFKGNTEIIKNRYDFVLLIEAKDSNPNGDPDNNAQPRTDPITEQGIITSVCIKRKIRDAVLDLMANEPGFRIYIQNDASLNSKDAEACAACKVEPENLLDARKSDPGLEQKLRDWMLDEFYDLRTFGGVMTTFTKGAMNCGQITGPVQISNGRSIDPIRILDNSLTRKAITTDADAEKKKTEMGAHQYIVPYGLYRAEGHISANLAKKLNHFTEQDLELFWKAILCMFDLSISATRPGVAVRDLIVFKHESHLGNAPAHKLFERVVVKKKDDVTEPMSYDDYIVTVDEASLPAGVTCQHMA